MKGSSEDKKFCLKNLAEITPKRCKQMCKLINPYWKHSAWFFLNKEVKQILKSDITLLLTFLRLFMKSYIFFG